MNLCNLCPRNCNADRENGRTGFCGQTEKIRVARAALHYWEEPCISGENGSGAVFFCGCNLGCIYCQNYEIAHSNSDQGVLVDPEQLVDAMLRLQEQGANNINLVTPSHYVRQLEQVIPMARRRGIKIPFVYNTSSYESVESLKRLEGLIDIYLPDFKYRNVEKARKYSFAPDYPEIARKAIAEMFRQVGSYEIRDGLMKHGMIVRHMVLPLGVHNAKDILQYLYETYGNRIFVSIMNQYTPPNQMQSKRELPYAELNRRVTKREYDQVMEYAIELGFENAFFQEGETAKESFIPSFHGEGIIN